MVKYVLFNGKLYEICCLMVKLLPEFSVIDINCNPAELIGNEYITNITCK